MMYLRSQYGDGTLELRYHDKRAGLPMVGEQLQAFKPIVYT